MTKFTAKLTTKLRQELAKSKQISGYVGPTYMKGNNMTNDSMQMIKTKLKNRDLIPRWNYINRGPLQNIKYRILQAILNLLERKPKPGVKERLLDAHFDSELRHLIKDEPVHNEGTTQNGFVRKN